MPRTYVVAADKDGYTYDKKTNVTVGEGEEEEANFFLLPDDYEEGDLITKETYYDLSIADFGPTYATASVTLSVYEQTEYEEYWDYDIVLEMTITWVDAEGEMESRVDGSFVICNPPYPNKVITLYDHGSESGSITAYHEKGIDNGISKAKALLSSYPAEASDTVWFEFHHDTKEIEILTETPPWDSTDA